MPTYTFTQVSGGSTKFKKDSGPYHILRQSDIIDPTQGPSGNIDSLLLIWQGGREIINTTIDTVVAGSTTYTPGSNIDTIHDALNVLITQTYIAP